MSASPYAPLPRQSRPTNSMAVVSVISGAVGWMGVPFIASLVAIVAGHMARQQIRTSGEDGDQLAIIGLILGYSHIVLMCLVVGFLVLVYGAVIAAVLGVAATQPPP